jgi:hypothetical protein
MPNYRQQLSGSLRAVAACPSCVTPPTYNYYIAKGCPGGTYDGFDRKVKSTASLNYNGTPTSGDSFSEFGSCWYIDGASTETAYDANLNCGCGAGNTCPSADCSSLDVSDFAITSGCTACTGVGTLTPFYSTSAVYAQKEFVCDFVAAFTLLYHNGTDTLPSVGDTIYAGSTTSSQTVSWSNHKGFNEVEGDNSTVSGTTNAQGVIASTWQCQ